MKPALEKSAVEVLQGDMNHVFEGAREELNALRGRRVLVTGGGGFLGYLLCHVLGNYGEGEGSGGISLTIFDNFSRGRRPWLDALAQKSNVEVRNFDITAPLPSDMARFDYIVHAASIASPVFYRKHPIETIDANVYGTRHILEYGRARKEKNMPVAGILFFSTSEIYGDPTPDAIPTPETFRGLVSCTGPRACYDESKRLGETLCSNFAREFGVQVSVARPFNNYGPGLHINDQRVFPDFARNILNNEDIVLFSDGRATRTFCYVADAVVGYLKILTRGRAGEAYNIGTEAPEISMSALANAVAAAGRELFGYRGGVVLGKSEDTAYLADNPNRRCPNIEKARGELGFDPSISLDDGIQRSLQWYRDNRA